MRIAQPVLSSQLEKGIALEEALSMASSDESSVTEYHFEGGSAAEWDLNKSEYRSCVFSACRLTGAHLEKAWLRDVVFERCELSGVRLVESTLHRVRFVDCKLSGVNLAGAALQDVCFQNCTADGMILSESGLKNVCFRDCKLQEASFSALHKKAVFEASFSALHKKAVFSFERCDLRAVDFFHTPLKDVDLTSSDIDGIRLEGSELRGAVVTALQACELAKLLGVVIKS